MMGRLNKEGIGLGSYVDRVSMQMRGRVTSVHFSCPEDDEWVALQSIPIRPEALQVPYVWFTVLVDGGGAVVLPAYDVTPRGAFMLDNAYASEYFPVLCNTQHNTSPHDWQHYDAGKWVCLVCEMEGRWRNDVQGVVVVRGSELTIEEGE